MHSNSHLNQINQKGQQYIQDYLNSDTQSYKPKLFIRNPFFADSTTYKQPNFKQETPNQSISHQSPRVINGRYCQSLDAQINKRSWAPLPGYNSQVSLPNYNSQVSLPNYNSQVSLPVYNSQVPLPVYNYQMDTNQHNKSDNQINLASKVKPQNYEQVSNQPPQQYQQNHHPQQPILHQRSDKTKEQVVHKQAEQPLDILTQRNRSLHQYDQQPNLIPDPSIKGNQSLHVMRHNLISDRVQFSYQPKFDIAVKWDHYNRPQFKDFDQQGLSHKQIVQLKNQDNKMEDEYLTSNNKSYGVKSRILNI